MESDDLHRKSTLINVQKKIESMMKVIVSVIDIHNSKSIKYLSCSLTSLESAFSLNPEK